MCELNLWGIETAFKKITAAEIDECELNLWGIETKIEDIESFAKDYVWIEPVRDWVGIGFRLERD